MRKYSIIRDDDGRVINLKTNQGVTTMTIKTAAAAALMAAIAASPFAAANGDDEEEYQFIISGDPVAAATVGSSSSSSATAALVGGPIADGVVFNSVLEARYRTMDESNTSSLRSDKAGYVIVFR